MATKPSKPTKWDKLPSMTEDVVRRSREDLGAIRRGMGAGASKLSGTAQDVVKEAGARGLTRMAGRVAPAAAALEAGYTLGREIDERTGAGKKVVDESGLGRAAGRAALAGREGAKLSAGAKQRMADMENDEALRSVDTERAASKYGKGDEEGMKRGGKVKKYAAGGSVSASRRADGIAAKGKTRGRMC